MGADSATDLAFRFIRPGVRSIRSDVKGGSTSDDGRYRPAVVTYGGLSYDVVSNNWLPVAIIFVRVNLTNEMLSLSNIQGSIHSIKKRK